MNQKQRELLANKIADLGNYAMFALYFSFIIKGASASWQFPVIAVLMLGLCYLIAYYKLKEGK